MEAVKALVTKYEERPKLKAGGGGGGGGDKKKKDEEVLFFGEEEKPEAEIVFEAGDDKDAKNQGWDDAASPPPGLEAAGGWS